MLQERSSGRGDGPPCVAAMRPPAGTHESSPAPGLVSRMEVLPVPCSLFSGLEVKQGRCPALVSALNLLIPLPLSPGPGS